MEDRPTAIFTGSDEIAGGMMIEAKESGLSIPNDLAIMDLMTNLLHKC